jgi:N-methylhydantoinase A
VNAVADRYRLAIDVGGTFIDFVLLNEQSGVTVIEKQPSTAGSLVSELLAGVARLPVPLEQIGRIFHGTTAGINSLVQNRGARVGLITTAGFRDVLALGRGRRPHVYDAVYQPPPPLIPRHLRREVEGRLGAGGAEVTPLDLGAVELEADELASAGVEAIAVCFLHAYASPEHEQAAAAAIRKRHPGLAVSASHELTTEWREFERTSTTVLNASIQPLLSSYLDELRAGLASGGFRGSLAIMQSNGGVMSASAATRRPIRTLLSGPAGGVIGAHVLAGQLDLPNVICADVGGTTYDVAVIENGEILEATESEISGRPIIGSSIDIVSIGAGGGSIAWIDETGAVQVGPQSAGATPGPACYGAGGTEPTVTDCQLLLGWLDADTFLGARMHLDTPAAERALGERIARPTGIGLIEAAHGVLRIAETNMTYAIRSLTVERGLDPREFALCSYGGGGGLFAASVARELDIPKVLIPRAAANFSAAGIMISDYRDDTSATRILSLDAGAVTSVVASLRELAGRASGELNDFGFADDEIELMYRADLRFAGQDDAITVVVERAWLEDEGALVGGLRRRFEDQHRQLYGYALADAPLEVVNCRCRGVGRVHHPTSSWPAGGGDTGPASTRRVYFSPSVPVETQVFDRDALSPGTPIHGPAIVEEWTTTVLVPPGWAVEADPRGHLVLSDCGGDR